MSRHKQEGRNGRKSKSQKPCDLATQCVLSFSVQTSSVLLIPVDETPTLQVIHAASNLGGHIHKHYGIDLVLVAIA
jgi:hypothetical protein